MIVILFLIAQSFLTIPAFAAGGSQPSDFELFCKQAKGPDIKVDLQLQNGEIKNLNARIPNSALKVTVTSASPGILVPVNVSFARSKGVAKNVEFTNLGLVEQTSNNFFGIKSCVINDLKKVTAAELPHAAKDDGKAPVATP